MTVVEVFVALAILVGIAGIVVPILPGTLLILGAVLVWTLDIGTATAWTVFSVVTVLLVAGAIVKYAVPGRQLKASGVPTRTLVAGGLLGIVGFFVVPVVGLVLGFVLGIYLSERQRLGSSSAWPSTKSALMAVGLSILIELAFALLAAIAWAAGVVVT